MYNNEYGIQNFFAMFKEPICLNIRSGMLWSWFLIKKVQNWDVHVIPDNWYATKIVICAMPMEPMSNKISSIMILRWLSVKKRYMFLSQNLVFSSKSFFVQCLWTQCTLKSILECCGGDLWWKKCKLCWIWLPEIEYGLQNFFAMFMEPISLKISSGML